ncbi:MAG: ABC transporter ATP-binding protein [Phycisphaeraceae bacterium]|nr:ABC transporter ATP-binding protein [Phycisphaeraceae bacterium]MCW5754784.1 ABC transporter ATP-binding protein [Phycisphaeraceae bacterium]
MPTAISIREILKVFSSARGKATAVDRVSLDVAPGELFFLLGPSGCGKTTLLRMIAGFIDPTGGRIAFNDKDVTHVPPNKRNTGMVFQSYALWPHMTVEQNVAFGLKVRRIGKPERDRRVAEALAAVRLGEYAKRRPNELSGGQQQRVALARALVIRPDVLLLDEPLSNLDAKLRIELRAEIRRICKESGITSLYVTHDQKEALSMADRIAIMSAGKVVQVGTPEELYRRPATRFVAEFLGETNIIPAEVASAEGGVVELKTGAGVVRSSAGGGATVGERVMLSIRPESWRIGPGPNTLSGKRVGSTYLGEMLQEIVELPGLPKEHARVFAYQVNPAVGAAEAGVASRELSVDPADVVVLRG